MYRASVSLLPFSFETRKEEVAFIFIVETPAEAAGLGQEADGHCAQLTRRNLCLFFPPLRTGNAIEYYRRVVVVFDLDSARLKFITENIAIQQI